MTFAIRGCSPNFNLRADAFINFMLLSFLHQYIVNNLSLKNVLKDIGKRYFRLCFCKLGALDKNPK